METAELESTVADLRDVPLAQAAVPGAIERVLPGGSRTVPVASFASSI